MIDGVKRLLLEKWEECDIGSGKPASILFSLFSKDQQNGNVFIYVFDENNKLPLLIVKVRNIENAGNQFQRQYDNLRYVHESANLRDYARCLPRPLFCEKYKEWIIYSETFVNGRQLKNMFSLSERNRYLEKSAQWLGKFHSQTFSRLDCSDEELKESVFLPRSHFEKINEYGLNLLEIDRYITGKLKQRKTKSFPFVFYHGDFSSYNILAINGELAVLDWEYSQIKGAPLLDLLNLLAYYDFPRSRGSFYGSFSAAFIKESSFYRLSRIIIQRYLDLLGIEYCLIDAFMLRFLLELVFLKDQQRQEKDDIVKIIRFIIKGEISFNFAARGSYESSLN